MIEIVRRILLAVTMIGVAATTLSASAAPLVSPGEAKFEEPQTCPSPPLEVATIKPTSRAEIKPDRQEKIRNALVANSYDVITLGDSIMEGWGENRLSTAMGLAVLNAGFGQDGTEHTLWRLQAMDWHSQSPRYVLLLVGTNDLGHPACDVYWGIRTVVQKVRALFPKARVVVISILPRGANMMDNDEKIRMVNGALKAVATSANFTFFDVHDAFLCEHRTPCALFQFDHNLHLTKDGYDLLTETLRTMVQSWR